MDGIGDGVAIELPKGLIATERLPARRRRTGADTASATTPEAELDAALADAEFETVKDIVLEAEPGSGRRGPGSPTAGPARIKVEVAGQEDAVLLLEGEGGVFQWVYPDGGDVAEGARRGGETRVFTLGGDAGSPDAGSQGAARRGGARRNVFDWVGDRLIDPVRVRVLRFAVGQGIDVAVRKLEDGTPLGLVVVDGDPTSWTAGAVLPTLPSTAPARVLLLVHGTFSTTAGSYGALAATEDGREFLKQAGRTYHAVLGFDHKTLALDPDQNARDMLEALKGLPRGTRIDAVAYSRGGLVYRAFAERIAPQKEARPDLVFGEAVFVGCTNAGTNLAEPANWKALTDLYTNVAMAGARAIGLLTGGAVSPVLRFTIKTLGRFVQIIPEVGVADERVPGLAAMRPSGNFVTTLNGADSALPHPARYAVVASDFQPRIELSKGLSGELVEFLLNRMVDRLLGEANDLVVHSASMSSFGSRAGLLARDRVEVIPPAQVIYHTIYFASPTVARLLSTWLLAPSIKRAEPPPPGPRPPRRTRRTSRGGSDDGAVEVETPATLEPSVPVTPAAVPAAQGLHFAAEMSPTPRVEQPASVWVTVSREAILAAVDNTAKRTDETVVIDEKQDILLQVIGLENCAVTEGEASEWTLAPPRAEPAIRRFYVTGFKPGAGKVHVEARQGSRVLAAFLLEPVFIGADEARLTASSSAIGAAPSAEDPAVLRIFEITGADGRLTLRYDLSSFDPEINEVSETRLPHGFNLGALAGVFLQKLDDAYDLDPESYDAFLSSIRNFSIVQTDGLIPEVIRESLWKNREAIKAIQVISDSPHIPWELLCVVDPRGGKKEEGRFLCEWGLVRWLYNARWPVRRLALRGDHVRYVVPDYLDKHKKLLGATNERRMLSDRFSGASEIYASAAAVTAFLDTEAQDADVLHFACHGEAKQQALLNSDLVLTGRTRRDGRIEDDRLSYDDVEVSARFADDKASGLVFINACQTGMPGEGVAGVAGFAEAFIRPKSKRGAAAFVGALWSVDDVLALTFADTFYGALTAGETLVEAARRAREACKKKGDFTWLAYSVYGAPFARAALE